MLRLLAVALSAAIVSLLGAGAAVADPGNACPPQSPAGEEATPPDCGHGKSQSENRDKGDPPCDRGRAGEKNPHCADDGDGDGNGNGNGNGNGDGARACEGAELDVFKTLSEDAPTVLCLFAPGNENAVEENCPDNTLFLGGTETGAICLLPAEESAARAARL